MNRKRLIYAVITTLTLCATSQSYASPTVNLGTAGNYAILAEQGISDVGGAVVTGNIGNTAQQASYITGFALSWNGSAP